MKLLYLNDWNHLCNYNALKSYGFDITEIKRTDIDKIDLKQYDCVYGPSYPVNASKYPNVKFIFGPHFSEFPSNNKLNSIRSSNTVYILTSDWIKNIWMSYDNIKGVTLKVLPFAVNIPVQTDIRPIIERSIVFVYFKERSIQDLRFIEAYLNKNNINYKVFKYGTYKEEEYIKCLKSAKYAIWIGRHETQGFALETALAYDVPLLVWDVTQLNGKNMCHIATTIPYWDNRCGEYFHQSHEFETSYNMFLKKLHLYNPRRYIIENLSKEVCRKRFIDIVNSITTSNKNLVNNLL
jgi:hypothetical protein